METVDCKNCKHRIFKHQGEWYHVCKRERKEYLGVVCKEITGNFGIVERCGCIKAKP